jgi:5-methylcytosine-specific restriction endonuclease McrA
MKRNSTEYNKHKKQWCEVCGKDWPNLDIDHVKSFGSGGNDDPANLMTLCRICHIERHQLGTVGMSKKYLKYHNWLIENEWTFSMGKWLNPKAQRGINESAK